MKYIYQYGDKTLEFKKIVRLLVKKEQFISLNPAFVSINANKMSGIENFKQPPFRSRGVFNSIMFADIIKDPKAFKESVDFVHQQMEEHNGCFIPEFNENWLKVLYPYFEKGKLIITAEVRQKGFYLLQHQ